MKAEKRFISADLGGLELRGKGDEPKVIEGYGAVFYNSNDAGTEYPLWQDHFERIMPGAFDRAVKEDDVRSLFNHDINIVLGRTKAGTLSLTVDSRGLKYSVTIPDTNLVRDQVVSPLHRGDVDGSSFMFVPRKSVWREEERDDRQVYIREIEDVELWEVGPAVFPAYESSTSGLRAIEAAEARSQFDAWAKEHLRNDSEQARKKAAVVIGARMREIEGAA